MSADNTHNALTVTELNNYIKGVFDNDRALQNVYVKGEISNFKSHSTGHLYFSLKDEGGVLRAVMFRSSAGSLPFIPENGMKVIAHGRISSFVRDGQYQLYADSMEPDGIGALYIAYEQLKRKLEGAGLFDPKRKKALPKIPSRIGIITSPTGAAIRDMINVTGRRFPYAKIILYPALVQGPGAAPDLIRGLEYFNNNSAADVIIIGRGGGSIEDLWAFNDEKLAYAVAMSNIPVISAVGHETDFTICDFVADRRAPTPSAAAEIAVPDTLELKTKFNNVIKHEAMSIERIITRHREKLSYLSASRTLTSPRVMIDDKRMATVLLAERMQSAEANAVNRAKLSLGIIAGKLEALNPLSVIARGYSAVYKENKELVKSVDQLSVGMNINFKTSDGSASATVIEINKES
ncbi:MAG: exodeoxyribonuclease VII large subunit [Clostridia bacterium]|nr:exodeoxyribonuclease VII large subunit [Clostridia bacterium]